MKVWAKGKRDYLIKKILNWKQRGILKEYRICDKCDKIKVLNSFKKNSDVCKRCEKEVKDAIRIV